MATFHSIAAENQCRDEPAATSLAQAAYALQHRLEEDPDGRGPAGPALHLDGHDPFAGIADEEEHDAGPHIKLFALRIEGRKWVNDITLAQAWAILAAVMQELDTSRDLLFMMLLPNGQQPALCLNPALFSEQIPSPAALAARLKPRQHH